MTEISNFENSTWRKAAILKMFVSLYLSRVSSDFNEIRFADANFGSNSSHVAKYNFFCKSNRAAGRHIENRYWGISQRFIVRLTRNLVRRSKIMIDTGNEAKFPNAKFLKFKMADGRHFENGLIAISQPRIIHFQ